MSDSYLRIIPTDPVWQPTAEAAAAAVAFVTGLFAGPGDYVESVEAVFHEGITLIDGGEFMEDVSCPECEVALGLAWFWETLRERSAAGPAVEDLNVTVPCCGAALTLPDLWFEAPIGFARFEVCATNVFRSAGELTDDELGAAGAALGHPVTQIHTRY